MGAGRDRSTTNNKNKKTNTNEMSEKAAQILVLVGGVVVVEVL